MRRMVTFAAVCAAGIALAGCQPADSRGTTTPSSSPTVEPSASPSSSAAETRRIAARLAAGVRRLTADSFRFEGGSGIARATGAFDPVHRRGDITGTFGIGSGDVRVVGTDLYATGFDDGTDHWVHVDTTRLAPGNVLTEAIDPTVGTLVFDAVDSATRTGPSRYSGTVDVRRLTDRAAGSGEAAGGLLAMLGNPSEATFQATLDSSGRLTELVVTVPDGDSSANTTLRTRYYDFGVDVTVRRPPAAQTEEAPAALYTVLAPTVSAAPTPS